MPSVTEDRRNHRTAHQMKMYISSSMVKHSGVRIPPVHADTLRAREPSAPVPIATMCARQFTDTIVGNTKEMMKGLQLARAALCTARRRVQTASAT
jgi:hypothetical protein